MANDFTPQQIEQFLQEFFDVVGARQYVGARYVPIFGRGSGTSIDWDNSDAYEPLSIVYYQGDTYTSRRYVPAGVTIDNRDYWVITGRYNAQVEQYRQEVLSFQSQIDDANDAISTLRNDVADDYVPFPDSDHYPKFGTMGQVLSTLANGTTKWDDPVVPSDAQAEEVITAWLNDHPEATTTVQDGSITWAKLADALRAKLLHATNTLVQSSNYSTTLPDADLQANNAVHFIVNSVGSGMTQHLPVYGQYGVLFKVNFSESNVQGGVQFYATFPTNLSDAALYYRGFGGVGSTPTFTAWKDVSVPEDASVTWSKLAESIKPYMLHVGGHVQSNNYQTVMPNADLQPNNTIYLVNSSIASNMTQNLPIYDTGGVLVKFSFNPTNGQGTVQMYITRYSAVYVRLAYGNGNVPTFGPWNRLFGRSEKLTHDTAMIFRKVVACGDSYTAGWINNVSVNEDYAWPSYMSKITGQSWVNCGSSGATVLSWQTAARGLPAAQAAGPAQAYVIGLMINDVGNVTLGSPSDIGTQAQTYYGGLSQIVEALNAISPSAKIFIQTCPRTTDAFQPFNQAVRDVVAHYANTMSTHLLDLHAHIDLYDVPSITGDAKLGHYTAIGYEQFAQNLNYIMSDYINTHISAFQDVYAIPTA